MKAMATREPIVLASWPALLLAPLLALGVQSIAYSLVTPSCAHQDGGTLHLLSAATLLLAVLATAIAGVGWRRAHATRPRPADAGAVDLEGGRDLFLARVATLVGAFSALTIAAMWIPVWFLSPCH